MRRVAGFVLVALVAGCKGNINNNQLPLPLTSRVSIDSLSFQANSLSEQPSISADGQYVAFRSFATNLVPGDTEGKSDIFLKETSTGLVIRVSIQGGHKAIGGNGDSSEPALADSATIVAFTSAATNLDEAVAGDNAVNDVFLMDVGKASLVQVSMPKLQPTNGASSHPSISSSGDIVVFQSDAKNLNVTPADSNSITDIYLFDRQATAPGLTRISTNSGGFDATASCINPMVSGNGKFVVWQTTASNFGVSDANVAHDIVYKDLGSGATQYVSVRSDGLATGDAGSFDPYISSDGRYVVFSSDATDLVAGDGNGLRDIFIRDMSLGVTTRVSLSATGGDPDGASNRPTVSADGKYVAFDSASTNLISLDTNAFTDVFIANLSDGTTQRASVRTYGGESAGAAVVQVTGRLSQDARFITMVSTSPNLVDNDTNTTADVFLRGPLK